MQLKSKTKHLETQSKHPTSSATPSSPFPKNHLQSNLLFQFGSEVEVTSDEEGFKGAWYLATVIQSPSTSASSSSSSLQQKGKIFVEYKNLLSDENGNTVLKEFVDVSFVRPKQPIEDDDKVVFEVNDVVDAFYQDGWWSGVVTCVVSRNKYRVFFSNPPDEMEFQSYELRIHKNWVDGKWLLPHKERMSDWNFNPGTAVEVNIDSDISFDVWFPAILIQQVANNTFLVEYQSSKEAGLQKVAVDSLHIRPAPPSSSNKAFNLLEKVDAFYDFRWLSGVVTKILADGRYIVYFKRTKKEKELSHADLRLHMEWHNGKWIQSFQDTSMTSNVEKRSNHMVNGGNKEKTRASSEGPGAAKSNVALDSPTLTVKSCPKESQTSDDGKSNCRLPAAVLSNKKKQTNTNGNGSRSRPSRRSIEEPSSDVPLSPDTCKSKMTQLEVSNNGALADADHLTPGHLQSSSKQSEGSSPYSTEMKEENEKHSASKKKGRLSKLRAERALLSGDTQEEIVDQNPNKSDAVKPFGPIVIGLTHDGKMISSLGESSSRHLRLENKKAVEDEAKCLNSSADHESVVSNGNEQQKEVEVTNLKRKRGRPPKVLFRLGSPKNNEAETIGEDKIDDASAPKEGASAPKDGASDTKDGASDTKDGASDTKDGASDTKDGASDPKDGASGPKDNEIHSPTNEVVRPIATVEPSLISGSSPTDDGIHVSEIRDHMKRLSDVRKLSTRTTSRRQGRKRKKVPTKSVMMDINEPVKSVFSSKEKRQKLAKKVAPQTVDDVGNSRIRAIEVFNNGVARDVDSVVAGNSSNASDDDRPLSTWFVGAHSPTVDAKFSSGSTAGQSGDSSHETKTAHIGQLQEKEQDIRQYTSAENVSQEQDQNVLGGPDKIAMQSESSAIVSVDVQDLPFVKNSLVWKMIESMEVLKRVPQKPHFRPLYNCKEECREGLAIGSMVTFTSLVERISKSQFSDPKSLLDGYLEALVDLEDLGFNVAPVRAQLNKMISVKARHEQAQNTSKEIESQITELNLEKSEINEEVAAIDKKIGELMEKRTSVMAKKERKEAEITLLQSSIDSVKGALESAEREFEKAATSLW